MVCDVSNPSCCGLGKKQLADEPEFVKSPDTFNVRNNKHYLCIHCRPFWIPSCILCIRLHPLQRKFHRQNDKLQRKEILSLNFLWCYCSTAQPNLQANPRRGLIPSSQKSHCPHQTRLSVLGRLFPRKKGSHSRQNTIDTKFNKIPA